MSNLHSNKTQSRYWNPNRPDVSVEINAVYIYMGGGGITLIQDKLFKYWIWFLLSIQE